LNSFLVLLAVVTASQGSAVQLSFPHEPGVKSVVVRWAAKKVPAVRLQDKWVTVLGIDVDAKAGESKADVLYTMEDGRVDNRETVIRVEATKFPTTELKVADRFVQLNAKDQERANREATEIESVYSKITNEILWEQPFTVPIPGGVGSNFGHRRVFNGEARSPHAGADLRAQTGTPIQATNRGRVVLAKDLFFTGNTVMIDHGLGIYSLYAHLSRIDVKAGASVARGQAVGLAGATGRVTGPHLHWGVRIQGARVDPFSLMKMEK
jgi:murein DD-endopeptidase MepM/ murein hydrolase activator NlpD